MTRDGIVVRKTHVPGDKRRSYAAFVPSRPMGEHSSLVYDKRLGWLGRIGSERLPFHLNALPAFTDKRRDAVRAFHASLYKQAYAAILEAHPELEHGRRCDGEIVVDA